MKWSLCTLCCGVLFCDAGSYALADVEFYLLQVRASTCAHGHVNVGRRWVTANEQALLRPHIKCMSAEGRKVRAGGAMLEGLLVRWRADMQPKEFSLSKAELVHWFSLRSRTVQGTGLARVRAAVQHSATHVSNCSREAGLVK